MFLNTISFDEEGDFEVPCCWLNVTTLVSKNVHGVFSTFLTKGIHHTLSDLIFKHKSQQEQDGEQN
jgi:hypothetical protein